MEVTLAVGSRSLSGSLVLCVVVILALAESVISVPVNRPEPRCWAGVTRVEVDRIRGEECSGLERLDNLTCSDLQTVLLSIADARTVSECVEVLVYPGTYVINSAISIENQSLIVRGVGSVTVTFDFASFDPTQVFDPFYVLLIANLEYAEISGIDFTSSPGIVALENISTVVVFDCSFRHFYQGALDVYKSNLVYIGNCTFEHNGPVSVFKAQQYRGHAGGLSLGTEEEGPGSGEVFFMVTDCVFRNNTSTPPPDDLGATTRLLITFIFPGRGGGCSILMNTSFSANVTIDNCIFEDNSATNVAGGIYLGFSGYSSHEINITRTKFVRNRSQSGGALHYGFVEGFAQGADIVLLISSSEFVENWAEFGGATHFIVAGEANPDGRLAYFTRVENCIFTGNSAEEFGSAMASSTFLFLQYTGGITPLEIIDCEYINNTARIGGILSTAYVPYSFLGVNTFRGTRGRTLVVLGARVEVHGDMQFVGNGRGALNAGALYLTSLAQVELFPGASFLFEGNTGVIGAAIEVNTHQFPAVFSQLTFNPLCAFTYSIATQRPDTWNVSMNFTGNRGVYASAVFISNIDLCSWVIDPIDAFFDRQRAFRWNFITLLDNCNSAHAPDECNPEFSIQTPPVRINVLTDELSAYPGEGLSIPMRAFDELDKPSAAIVRVSEAEVHVVFSPSATILTQISAATEFALAEETATSHEDRHYITVETALSEMVRKDTLYLVTTTCPPGYILTPSSTQGFLTCTCDVSNIDIINCDGETILLEYGLWGTRGGNSDQLVTYPCPPQYCRCQQGFNLTQQDSSDICEFAFDSQNPDLQCNCDRKGTLCGECKDGRGVSVLLNYCVTCHNAYGILVVGLVLADIVALIVIFLVNRQLPDFIYPCLFYLQVLPFLAAFFPVTFEKVHPYLLYISSALSFYFVYDFCLYENMSPLVSYFMKYIPLFVSITAAFVVIRYRYKLSRVPWHSLWWVILLQYTHVVHTSMSILNCPTIESQNSTGTSWFVSGNINCFHGWHAPLGVLAILSLILCVCVIIIIVVYAMGWLERPWWIQFSVLPLKDGIGRKYPFWPAVELGRRLLLVLFIVAFPGNDYPAIFILTVFIATFGYLQPYKHLSTNILEVLLCITVLTMLLLRNTSTLTEEFQTLRDVNRNGTDGGCKDQFEGVTDLAILLATLYYAVLGISLCVSALWVFSHLRHYIKAKRGSKTTDGSEANDLEHSHYQEQAEPTTSFVTLNRISLLSSIAVITHHREADARLDSSNNEGAPHHKAHGI